jgi:putative oxidoreductase
MTQTKKTNKSATPNLAWAILLRVALGLILIWKAINFIADSSALELLTVQGYESLLTKNDAVFIVVFGMITVVSGFFIIAGRFTRMAAFIQLPVFLIGIVFIHGGYIDRNGIELILTAIVPFLLLVFITRGNHVLTTDANVRNKSRGFLESGNRNGRLKIYKPIVTTL